ncbi:hypothetical protein AMAG_19351 [Allomyces macrogynus ATCC 38327]|uniref:Uncharacterized protein n=1 Tax=Allomyces macrogynus (strain ATCC 38327) TaxID=578462 RepID=A0A0L0SUK7_ALLM3|nr:hypothetical protein AMAG_19351 [Allomyces macrogynus ATCC 38327]|eukprot:KNE66151.1 hypothetical protein AMAG_19351 [Allomyces macrogynus ATCC 38327]
MDRRGHPLARPRTTAESRPNITLSRRICELVVRHDDWDRCMTDQVGFLGGERRLVRSTVHDESKAARNEHRSVCLREAIPLRFGNRSVHAVVVVVAAVMIALVRWSCGGRAVVPRSLLLLCSCGCFARDLRDA